MSQEIHVSAGGVVLRKAKDGELYIALEQQTSTRPEWNDAVWFLPKGHVETGETIEEAAQREITEEAGATGLLLIQKIGVKKRIGTSCGKRKEIHYFLFETDVEMLSPIATDKGHRGAWFPFFGDIKLGFAEQQEMLEEAREIIRTREVKS